MKSNLVKCTAVILSITLFMMIFSACGNGNEENDSDNLTESVCLLYGNTRNVGVPNYDELKKEIEQMSEGVTDCSVIVIDGEPNTVSYNNTIKYPKTIPIFKKSSDTRYINNVMKDILNCKPDTEEIDILSALYNAQKALSKDDGLKKKIVIFSSGISTTGILNFSENPKLIEEDPSSIVNKLNKAKSIPDLTGVEIIWHGFGIVEPPQENLTKINEYRLKNIWNAILKECNATIVGETINGEISDEQDYISEEFRKDYPDVSNAEFPTIIEFDETQVQFESGTANFLDENEVYKDLKPYADLIRESGCEKFYIVGSTASADNNDKCLALSYKRAEAVKKVLCSYEVSPSYFEVYGIGREDFKGEFEWRVNDLNTDGTLNETFAKKNRKVVIVEQQSKRGQDFIEVWNKTLK